MRVTVRLFAILRDRAGTTEVTLELADGDTVQRASEELSRRLPPLADLLPRAAFAVNREYVPATTSLRDGDELAAIPPVSGGCS